MSDQKDGQNGGAAPDAGAGAAAAAAVGAATGSAAATGDAAQAPQPRLSILTQYIKDMSFENPRAPQAAPQSAGRPEIQIKVDVGADAMGEDRYQVTLQLNVDAKAAGETIFLMELSYGGVFQPLMIDPIDFVALYRRKLQEAQAQAQAQPQAPS